MKNPAVLFCSVCHIPCGLCEAGEEPEELYCRTCAEGYLALKELVSPEDSKNIGLLHVVGLYGVSLGTFWERQWAGGRFIEGVRHIARLLPKKKVSPESFSSLTFKDALNIIHPTTPAGKALLKRLDNESD